MIRCSAVVALVLMASLAAGSPPVGTPPADSRPGGSGDDRDTATLTVIQDLVPGETRTTVEFTRAGTLVRCRVTLAYDTLTRRDSHRGDLHAVYLVAAGKAHPNPAALRNPEALLRALRSLPLTITEKSKQEEGARKARRYELAFGRKAGA